MPISLHRWSRFILLLTNIYLIASCSSNKSLEFPHTVQVTLDREPHEACFKMKPDHFLRYSFQSSHPVSFSIHYHESNQVITVYPETEFSSETNVFQPEIPQVYCLMWSSIGSSLAELTYRFTVKRSIPENKIWAQYKAGDHQKSIDIWNNLNERVGKIPVGSTIVNFTLNSSGSVLALVTNDKQNNLRIYDTGTQSLLIAKTISRLPRYLIFSNDDLYLALANEHDLEVEVMETTHYQSIGSIQIPSPILAIENTITPNEFLARNKEEIIKLQFFPPKLLERKVKIRINLGGKEMLINPYAWCFAHGVPHPLFVPSPPAMSQGISGYFKPKLD